VNCMESEAERARLAGEHPRWRIWRNGSVAYAWLLRASPPPVLRDTSYDGLGRRIEAFEAAWEETRSYRAAMAAAEGEGG